MARIAIVYPGMAVTCFYAACNSFFCQNLLLETMLDLIPLFSSVFLDVHILSHVTFLGPLLPNRRALRPLRQTEASGQCRRCSVSSGPAVTASVCSWRPTQISLQTPSTLRYSKHPHPPMPWKGPPSYFPHLFLHSFSNLSDYLST